MKLPDHIKIGEDTYELKISPLETFGYALSLSDKVKGTGAVTTMNHLGESDVAFERLVRLVKDAMNAPE